jgi:hypothetical protein
MSLMMGLILYIVVLEWERPVTGKAVDINKLYSLCPSDSVLRGEHGYNLPPIFSTFDPRWKKELPPDQRGRAR